MTVVLTWFEAGELRELEMAPAAFHHWDVENTWDPEGTPETYHDHYMTVTEVTGGDI